MRWLSGVAGVLLGVYGAFLLLRLGWDNLVATVVWAAGGVIVHDGVIGPALIVAGAAALVLVPARTRAPVAAGLVVLGTVTVTAVPVLTRMGARADNSTLLDRNYLGGWLAFAVLVLLATAFGVVRALRASAPADDPSPAPEESPG